MGRTTKPAYLPSDLTTLAEALGVYVSKHRSCWLHIVACHYRREKKITREEIEEIKKIYGHSTPCYYRKYPHGERSNQMANRELKKPLAKRTFISCRRKNQLDTDAFENYLESLWKRFSEDKKMSFAYLDSLWFSLYRKPSTKPKVLEWIKQKCIFSKKYVFVPIVCWGHWSLLIFVHFGERLDSETKTPCMLLLDSLENADPKRLEPEIRKFVADIYRAEGRTEDKKAISRIPLLVPKVPQQTNDEECGNYVLYFINSFIESAPENFSISDGYPYFMKQNWFDPANLGYFQKQLEKELSTKKLMTDTAAISQSKLREKDGVISLDD